MKNRTDALTVELANLADDARALLSATADVAEENVVRARKRLASALDRGRDTWERVQDTVVTGVKTADKTVRKHPYESMGFAFGVGALIGYLLSKRF